MSNKYDISSTEKQGNTRPEVVAATWLAKRGFRVFPLKPGAKTPARKGWQSEAACDAATVKALFADKPDSNIGIKMGDGFFAFDCDRKDGKDGDAALRAALGVDAFWLDFTFTVATPSGGTHYVFRCPAGLTIRNSVGKIAPGVDIRGDGGYLATVGSVIDGKSYAIPEDCRGREPIDAPESILALVAEAVATAEPRPAPDGVELDTPTDIARAVEYLTTEALPAIEGSGGDDTTVDVAKQVGDFGVTEGEALALISEHYNPRCVPPWPEDDLAKKVENAYRYRKNAVGCDSITVHFDNITGWTPPANDNAAKPAARGITATPFVWRDPAAIPPREWLYGRHYIRRYATGTIAPGGTGKTSLVQTEALAMATGRDLIGGNQSETPLKVWLWNLEDPAEEVERRFAAAVDHHGIDPHLLDGHLFVNSGRDTPLVIAAKAKDKVIIAEPVIDALVAEIRANGIDVLVVDPFVSSHHLPENDNAAMDAAVKAWARVAHLGNCAVELVHHSRKLGGEAVSAESARGGSAFVDGCRGVRVINRMSEDDAAKLGIAEPRRFFYVIDDKPNMAPPPAGKRDWYQLVSVSLPNGDNVGAVDRYTPPNPLDDVSPDSLSRVQKAFAEGDHRYDEQATEWGGYAVASILGLDVGVGSKASRTPEQNAARAKVRDILRKLKLSGDIRVETRNDSQRRPRNFYASGEAAAEQGLAA